LGHFATSGHFGGGADVFNARIGAGADKNLVDRHLVQLLTALCGSLAMVAGSGSKLVIALTS